MGAAESASVSRCTCVCTSTFSPIWLSSTPEMFASEMKHENVSPRKMSPNDCGSASHPESAAPSSPQEPDAPATSRGSGTGCFCTNDGRQSRITLSETRSATSAADEVTEDAMLGRALGRAARRS